MIYRAIGIMSGSSLDGLDIAFVEFTETGGKWTFEIVDADCMEYNIEWQLKLKDATGLNALQYQLLHTAYGHFIGEQVNAFIKKYDLEHKVHLVASHGHTSFHDPGKKMTAQLGDGAAIAAVTGLSVVSDLRGLDVALGGQGAPIVPMGEKLLFEGYDYFLNIGGIANISIVNPPAVEGQPPAEYIAFDICAANRVLNMLAARVGLQYDEGGHLAAAGEINAGLLAQLNELDYYRKSYPKSLANSFGTETVYPLIDNRNLPVADSLRTYTEHIAMQVSNIITTDTGGNGRRMLVTGGGAFNSFLIERIKASLAPKRVELVIPDKTIVQYKEALIMALLGVLRWREEPTVLPSVTGAARGGIGGALWLG